MSDLKLADYPSAIREVKTRLQAAREAVNESHLATKTAELDLYERVREGTTSDKAAEKLMPQLKGSDPDYQVAYCAELARQREKAELEGELEQLRGEFAIALLDRCEDVATNPIIRALRDNSSLHDAIKQALTDDREQELPFNS